MMSALVSRCTRPASTLPSKDSGWWAWIPITLIFREYFFFNSARFYELLKCFSDLELVCMWALKINYLAFISRCAIVDFSRVFIARKLFAAYISRTTVARINVIYCCTLYSDMRNRALHSVLKKQCFLCSPFFLSYKFLNMTCLTFFLWFKL